MFSESSYEKKYCDDINNINGLDIVLSDTDGAINIDWNENETIDILSVIVQKNFLYEMQNSMIK